ncbi:TonB-dependent receptor [Chryseobacterium sp. A321]
MKKTVVALGLLGAVFLSAQESDSLKENRIDEVLVTASRKVESIKEVPSSVTIVGKKDIQLQMSVNSDVTAILQNTVPSLANTTYRTSSTGQTLRGRNVLVLIDGIPQSTPLRNGGRDLRTIDPTALERIEVIKGATSIYGNGADGGIINYITRKADPNKPLSGITQVGLTAQPYSGTLGYRASQYLSGQKNKFDFALTLAYERTGLLKDAEGQNMSTTYSPAEMDNYNGMLKVGYDINSDQRLELSYIGYASRSQLDFGNKVGVFGETATIGDTSVLKDPREVPQGTPRNHNAKLSYVHNQIFKNTALDVNLYYQDFRTVYGFSSEKTFLNGGQSNIKSRKKGLRFNLDTHLVSGKNSTVDLIYGADILNDVTAQKLEDGRFWTPNMDMVNVAPFALVKLDLGKKWILKGGLRYENAKVDVSDFNTVSRYNKVTDDYTESIFVQGGEINYNSLVGNFGIRYNLNEAVQFYSSWSQSFVINELGRILRESTKSIISELPTDPIIANNYEFGATGRPVKWLDYEMTAYVSSSKFGASYFTTPEGKFDILRAPEVIYGVEGYINLYPTSWLSLGTNYSYIEGLLDEDNDGNYEKKIYNARIMAPRMISYIQLRPSANFSAQLSMVNNFKQQASQAPNAKGLYGYGEAPVPAYTLFNLASSYRYNQNWKVSFGVENLFNKLYQPSIAWWTARDADFSNAPGMRGTLTLEYKF